MSKKALLKVFYFLLSIPHYLLAKALLNTNLWQLKEDFELCCNAVDSRSASFSNRFISVLALAEDHRSKLHFGIDYIAIVRAVFVRLRYKQIQGASTIEQQFVRVVTGRYKRNISRKLREQLLAILLSSEYKKSDVAESYLSVAYYGTGLSGVAGATALCGGSLEKARAREIIKVIACLKYPSPKQPCAKWIEKTSLRIQHIELLLTR